MQADKDATETHIARFIRDLDGFTGTAKLWKVGTEYYVTSATYVPGSGPETYIFKCDSQGEVTDWGDLPGSFRGGLDHEKAIRGAGWTPMASKASRLNAKEGA